MNHFRLFSSGLELANLVLSSDLLHHSWAAILDLCESSLPFSIKSKVFPLPHNGIIIAFVSSPTCTVQSLQGDGKDLISSATLRESFPLFEFLCTKFNPSFSIHKAAITLFASLHDELSRLKHQFGNCNPLIVTGHSIGGSIASLFTLWLLDSISPKSNKRPLCITFGSPLLGEECFQRAILERPTWNSCFLHIVSNQDPIPKIFISRSGAQSSGQSCIYKPFGTFLFCSESGCACFEEHESILKLMVAMSSESDGNCHLNNGVQWDYGKILKCLKDKAVCRGISDLGEEVINPLQTEIILQLAAVGVIRTEQQQMNNDMKDLVAKVEESVENFLIRKRNVFDPNKKLNDRKINMAYLEWYKKVTKDQGGYYDSYKKIRSSRDEIKSRQEIVKHHKILTQYWRQMVAEVERMPQKEWASFRTRWLYAGTNYRRMVEPLDIADFYKKNKEDYLTQGRSKHYELLEQWLNDDKPTRQPGNADERKEACSLTEDSCFWAHVEEAIISCAVLKDEKSSPENKELSRQKLIEFENFVMNLIRNRAVSPEIFSEKSSFMQWWRDYEKIKGTSNGYSLTTFMKSQYQKYA